jgi:hypothetical protein
MTMTFFPYQLPPPLGTFLSTTDLITFSTVDRYVCHQMKNELHLRKEQWIERLIQSFVYTSLPYHLSLSRQEERRVRILFQFLPELFQFIAAHKIISLDLSMVSSYGGYPLYARQVLWERGWNQEAVLDQLASRLASNTTLEQCNLALFRADLSNERLEEIFKDHPTIDHICMNPPSATSYYDRPPTTLWRREGGLYWAHFRNVNN